MIDIHAHILPGLDDGARDIYDSLEMAQLALESEVTAIVATPHCNVPGYFDNYFGREYIEAFKRVEEAFRLEEIPIKLYAGMEVFATADLPELLRKGKILTINAGNYLLTEFSFDEEAKYAEKILDDLLRMGIRPIVAHAERYEFVQDMPELISRWKKKGILIQANKGSFTGRFGKRTLGVANYLLDNYLLDVIASDCHGPDVRTPFLLDAYKVLCKKCDENYLHILFEENPRRICANQGVLDYFNAQRQF